MRFEELFALPFQPRIANNGCLCVALIWDAKVLASNSWSGPFDPQLLLLRSGQITGPSNKDSWSVRNWTSFKHDISPFRSGELLSSPTPIVVDIISRGAVKIVLPVIALAYSVCCRVNRRPGQSPTKRIDSFVLPIYSAIVVRPISHFLIIAFACEKINPLHLLWCLVWWRDNERRTQRFLIRDKAHR